MTLRRLRPRNRLENRLRSLSEWQYVCEGSGIVDKMQRLLALQSSVKPISYLSGEFLISDPPELRVGL